MPVLESRGSWGHDCAPAALLDLVTGHERAPIPRSRRAREHVLAAALDGATGQERASTLRLRGSRGHERVQAAARANGNSAFTFLRRPARRSETSRFPMPSPSSSFFPPRILTEESEEDE